MADNEVNEVPEYRPLQEVEELDEVNPPPVLAVQTVPQPEQQPHGIEERVDDTFQQTLRALMYYGQTFGFQSLLWMHFFWNILCQMTSATQTITRGVVRSLQPHLYVFFQGSSYPYRVQDYTLTGPGVPPIEWYYDADRKLFISSNLYSTTTEYESRHFEWLNGQIKYNDLLLHDVSEYLQQARWAGTARPSAAVLMSAWSLHSGILLHLSEHLNLHTINQDASESVISIRG